MEARCQPRTGWEQVGFVAGHTRKVWRAGCRLEEDFAGRGQVPGGESPPPLLRRRAYREESVDCRDRVAASEGSVAPGLARGAGCPRRLRRASARGTLDGQRGSGAAARVRASVRVRVRATATATARLRLRLRVRVEGGGGAGSSSGGASAGPRCGKDGRVGGWQTALERLCAGVQCRLHVGAA